MSPLSQATYRGEERCIQDFGGEVCGKERLLGRPRRRWTDNINVVLMEVGWEGADWVGLVQDRDKWRGIVNAVMNLRM